MTDSLTDDRTATSADGIRRELARMDTQINAMELAAAGVMASVVSLREQRDHRRALLESLLAEQTMRRGRP